MNVGARKKDFQTKIAKFAPSSNRKGVVVSYER